MELDFVGRLELVDDLSEEWWEIEGEGILRGGGISIETLLQVLNDFFFKLASQRLNLLHLLLIKH